MNVRMPSLHLKFQVYLLTSRTGAVSFSLRAVSSAAVVRWYSEIASRASCGFTNSSKRHAQAAAAPAGVSAAATTDAANQCTAIVIG